MNKLKKAAVIISAAVTGTMAFGANPVSAEAADVNYTYIKQVLLKVNAYRTQNNMQPVELNISLCDAASVRAEEIKTVFDHVRPSGENFHTAIMALNLDMTYASENIAAGFISGDEVMSGWINSAGHKANILTPEVTHMGVGISGTYWTQIFTAGLKGSPAFVGDTNYDGKLTAIDSAKALTYYSYQATYDFFTELDEFVNAADYNCDGKVTPVDAALILEDYADNAT